MQAAFCFSDDLQSTVVNLSCFSNYLKPQNPLQSAPSPVGEGWGEGILQIAAIFPNTLTAQIQALRRVALSSSLPQGERTGRLLELRVLQGKQVVQAAFCFSDGLQSTAANPNYFSNRLQPQKLPQSAPSPVGEGWGEGILQIAAIFPNTLTAQIQALRLVALSLTLSHGERASVGWVAIQQKIGQIICFVLGFQPNLPRGVWPLLEAV